jgi:TonB family protein
MNGQLRFAWLTTVAVAPVIATSCASGSAARELTPFPVLERTSGGCSAAMLPMRMPAVESILDTSLVMRALRARSLPNGQAVVSILIDPSNARPLVKTLSTDFAARDAEALTAIVDSALHHHEAPSGPWAVRLKLATGASPAAALERSEYCPPTAPEAQVRSRIVTVQVSEAELARIEREARESQARMRRMRDYIGRCLVTAEGRVAAIEVQRSSGDQALDGELAQRLRRTRFAPATLDGVPVPGWWTGNPMPPLP